MLVKMMKLVKNNILRLLIIMSMIIHSINSYADGYINKKLHAIYGNWRVLTAESDDSKMCYLVNYPTEKVGNHSNRRDAHLIINVIKEPETRIDPVRIEVSLSFGFTYKIGSKVYLNIGNRQFTMYTDDLAAWAVDKYADDIIVNSMMSGDKFMAKAESIMGTYAVDTYLLDNFSVAYNKARKLCGINGEE